DVITVYKDCNYTGFSGGLTIGDYNLARLNSLGVLNDDISSLRITQGYQAILYQDDNFGGASTVINSDNSCLNTTWNDKVSSIRVIANGTT
nr:Chain A, Carbohydrate binding protein [Flavobacterium johnsoniae UW101]3HZB_B Chain B, Carbohydrate binding protein [Flavobacterium johnsoniae UW101]3HZB_C Chain C, Carbohydrate binding protein [Flavobacterium johnsoniae UW101]3HZB_D Chain D, Carbohydrate binding protein [Flavobacterium johnsoniae UW101]3HZB_E Chain E, Carbohydrate binding protein [Flavobacterium johnsoniae UW101]3HZB_F Chain F, Carbohydrate binding protein [Flavobacterium johnsoniae UW101]3HZB_G Chain G, Carbohydrate bind